MVAPLLLLSKEGDLYVCTIKLVAKYDKSQKLVTTLLYPETKKKNGVIKQAGRNAKLEGKFIYSSMTSNKNVDC